MKTLKRSYAALGRLAHKALTPFFKLYVDENHVRVRVLVLSDDGREVLLIKSWLGRQKWSLPGGGIHKSETPAEAGAREVYEETGMRIVADQLQELGTFVNDDVRVPYMVACVTLSIAKRPPRLARHRRLEMLDVSWFPVTALPEVRTQTVDKALELLKNK